MEIRINIQKNDYVQPIEIREEVVQGICDAFLNGGVDSTFHPFSGGRFRNPTVYIWKWKGDQSFRGFESARDATDPFAKENKDVIRINGKEMETAFQILTKAGYHMFKVYSYGSWMGYQLSKKPFKDGATEVFTFSDFID